VSAKTKVPMNPAPRTIMPFAGPDPTVFRRGRGDAI